MTDIVWGDEIVVDGVRPEWLRDDEHITVRQGRGSSYWIDHGPSRTASMWHWKPIVGIKLPEEHPYYAFREIQAEATHALQGDIAGLHYSTLRSILNEAYDQAATGKGKERHANGRPWCEQPIAEIGRMVGTGFNTGQAIKKLQESSRMEPDAAVRELLGAIVYAASAIMLIREAARNG